jgi:molybdopterin/thiamine biosynthesis adenylyltransferase
MADQLKLLNSRSPAAGAGDLGSPISLYLAAAGVGTLGRPMSMSLAPATSSLG